MPSAFQTGSREQKQRCRQCGLIACRVVSRTRGLASCARVPGSASRISLVSLVLAGCVRELLACGG
eukprot:2495075-Pleurochrysis_carterae.AAC.1